MIKVIRHGYDSYRTTCDNCNCYFEYTMADVQNGHVYCPDCGAIILHLTSNNTGKRFEEDEE